MLPYLGLRGRVTTLAMAAAAAIGAIYAATDRDWTAVVSLVALAYLTVFVSVTWGASHTSVGAVDRITRGQQRSHRQEVAQLRLLRTKLERTHAHVARLSAAQKAAQAPVGQGAVPAQGQAAHVVERRYAGLLDEPMSAPNSRLLSLLEILAKDATTRRADDAMLRSAIHELRAMVEMQQAEISTLSQEVRHRDAFPTVHSAR